MTRLLPKPIIHGRDHACGGADPIPGICVLTGPVTNAIPGLVPGAYYRLNETSGDWIDSAGSRDLSYISRTGTVRGVDSDLDEADGSLCVTAVGPDPESHGTQSNIGELDDSYFYFVGTGSFSVTIRIRSDWDFPSVYPLGICGTLSFIGTDWNGWALRLEDGYCPGVYRFGTSVDLLSVIAAAGSYTPGAWMRLTATFDGADGTLTLYGGNVILGTAVDASPPSLVAASDYTLRLGSAGSGAPPGAVYPPNFQAWSPWKGELDSFALWDRALSAGEVGAIAEGDAGGGGGSVIGVDDEGNVGWVDPQGIEVEHGGGEPNPNPQTTAAGLYAGTPANAAGWHYQAHFEQVVLYSSTPGRFDVPSRKWTRVPFTTVRLQRRFELEVGGDFQDVWLEDDRGLSAPARNGILHVTPEMTFGATVQEVSGWFSVEYPMLDFTKLPNGGDPGLPDQYVRAARMVNLSTGSVLKGIPSYPNYYSFFDWPFFTPAEGDEGPVYWGSDSPYPVYPLWPARPLHKPPPYPKISAAASLNDYQTSTAHLPGFDLGHLDSQLHFSAGANICLQAWQDSPWLLRFGTDKYPPYTPWDYQEQWRKRPALVFRFYYDPDTIDHTTGVLL